MAIKYPSEDGPYLEAAFICEKVLQEIDGVKSAIRIIDRVNRGAIGPEPPAEMAPFNYGLTIFIRFKSGRARGSSQIQIQPIKPSGETKTPIRIGVLFEGEEDRGIDLTFPARVTFDQTGVWWFYVTLDGNFVTKIPFRVVYMPQFTPPPAGGTLPPPPA
ncbi:DUF6941 family protein [Chloroflexota bacterium]